MRVEQVDFITVEFFGETFDSSVCLMGFFKDPDGNTVILHNRSAPRVPR